MSIFSNYFDCIYSFVNSLTEHLGNFIAASKVTNSVAIRTFTSWQNCAPLAINLTATMRKIQCHHPTSEDRHNRPNWMLHYWSHDCRIRAESDNHQCKEGFWWLMSTLWTKYCSRAEQRKTAIDRAASRTDLQETPTIYAPVASLSYRQSRSHSHSATAVNRLLLVAAAAEAAAKAATGAIDAILTARWLRVWPAITETDGRQQEKGD
jgi:hypothetical protein